MNVNEIYNTDALAFLPTMPDESVDLIVTDPPYHVVSGGRKGKRNQPSGILSQSDGKLFTHNDAPCEKWFPELYRVLKSGCHCYVMVNGLNMEQYLRTARETGFKLHSILVWHKNNVTPSQWYMKNGEFILFLRKGRAKPINNVGSKSVHEFNNILGKKTHPTEKPVALMELYVGNSSNAGDVVFDPFCGTGSALIAAAKLNRRYIGCEIDPGYYAVACQRVKQEV